MYDNANYFGILPAVIRYDPKLSARAKIMYAMFTSLSCSSGKIFAGNKYLSDALDASDRTVARLIAELETQKYISVSYEYVNDTKEIARRVIRKIAPPLLLLDIPQSQVETAVIPTHILCKAELSVQAKLLYAEISAATPRDGFCSQPASFFAELLNASVPTVRRWIKELQDADAVRIEMEYRGDTREIRRRRIYLTVCAEIAEKRAESGVDGSKSLDPNNSLNSSDTANTPESGRFRGMLNFVTTSNEKLVRPRKLRRKRKKAAEILRL